MLATPSLSSSTIPLPLPQKPAFLHSKSTFHGLRIASPNLSSSSLRAQPSSSSMVMMSKKDEDLKEIRTKTNEQINDEILQLKGELFMLRLKRSAREDFKPSDFGSLRKRVARMLTVKREREIEQGVGKRLSRKLDKEWKRSIVVKPPPSLLKLQEEKATAEAENA
ncbi:large ribosomal subunit protein uL29c-like [Silene latifolia]|uniref:large ribosomal subunit protein uL29c-like n=1 Tax=Silene latifolia TaxID=37657 RepID=UPI003D776406